jgi:hypothetical protein
MSMEHPFINDLSDKSLEDLQETLSGLTTKIMFAQNSGNQPLVNQLRMVINSYQAEHKKKLDFLFAKQDIGDNIHVDGSKK